MTYANLETELAVVRCLLAEGRRIDTRAVEDAFSRLAMALIRERVRADRAAAALDVLQGAMKEVWAVVPAAAVPEGAWKERMVMRCQEVG